MAYKTYETPAAPTAEVVFASRDAAPRAFLADRWGPALPPVDWRGDLQRWPERDWLEWDCTVADLLAGQVEPTWQETRAAQETAYEDVRARRLKGRTV